jgi:hypothetical protein
MLRMMRFWQGVENKKSKILASFRQRQQQLTSIDHAIISEAKTTQQQQT